MYLRDLCHVSSVDCRYSVVASTTDKLRLIIPAFRTKKVRSTRVVSESARVRVTSSVWVSDESSRSNDTMLRVRMYSSLVEIVYIVGIPIYVMNKEMEVNFSILCLLLHRFKKVYGSLRCFPFTSFLSSCFNGMCFILENVAWVWNCELK